MSNSNSMETNHCPPGFELTQLKNHSKKEVPHIPLIEWKSPPKFVMSDNWCVAAGEESKEVETQKLREIKVFEAIYPRSSAIPPSPFVGIHADEPYDDSLTPVVPLIPIEEEDCEDAPSGMNPPVSHSPPTSSNSLPTPANLENPAAAKFPEVGAEVIVAATTAALAANRKTDNQGSFIDADLLIKILSNPKMIQELVPGALADSARTPFCEPRLMTKPDSFPLPQPDTQRPPKEENFCNTAKEVKPCVTSLPDIIPGSTVRRGLPSVPIPSLDQIPASMPLPANGITDQVLSGPIRGSIPAQTNVAPLSSPVVTKGAAPVKKDLNYYKNLIKWHGEQPGYGNRYKQQEMKMVQNLKAGNMKRKDQIPCIYFKTQKGCRNGASCQFLHDASPQLGNDNILELQRAKRMRLSGEMADRTTREVIL